MILLGRLLVLVLATLWANLTQAQEFIRYYPPVGLSQSGGTLTGALVLPDGLVGAPSLRFASSATSGLYSPGSGILDFSFGGVQKFRVATAVSVQADFSPQGADAYSNGSATNTWLGLSVNRFLQGSRSKTIVDNTATAFVRLSVADDNYEGCGVIYTAYAEDTATDARQTRTGRIYAAILNNGGTEAVAFSTGDSAVAVTAGTFTCTFDGNSGAADTIDLRATCDTSLAATTTLTFEWRLDCPSTVTVTPQ